MSGLSLPAGPSPAIEDSAASPRGRGYSYKAEARTTMGKGYQYGESLFRQHSHMILWQNPLIIATSLDFTSSPPLILVTSPSGSRSPESSTAGEGYGRFCDDPPSRPFITGRCN